VTPKGTREVYMEKVHSFNNAGSGYVTRTYFQTYHLLCGFDQNDEWGIECNKHHHTNNIWDSCHIGDNGKGGVLFTNVDKNTVFTNSIIIRNGGPGVKNELPDGYPRGNNGIRQVTFKDSVFIQNDGPAFLNKDVVVSWGIVFADCRVKKNGQNPRHNLTEPIGGVVHLEDSVTHVELRGLEEWSNGTDGTTCYHATGNLPGAGEGARTDYNNLLVGGAVVDEAEGSGVGDIVGPKTVLSVTNDTTVQGTVDVKSGVGLDPKGGGVISY